MANVKPLCGTLVLALLSASQLCADGGTLVFSKSAGPYTVSLFSNPQPVRVGAADLSVLIQRTDSRADVSDAKVRIHLTQSSANGISEVVAPATHANATNKLLYAARVNVPSTGQWRVAVDFDSKDGSALTSGTMDVLAPEPPLLAYWPYFVAAPLALMIFALNRKLKRRHARRLPTGP